MIPVRGVEGQRLLVLGLARSGRAVAQAIADGDGTAIVWDDNAEARAQAETDGFTLADPSRNETWDDVSRLVVSPGIPHLYPEPNRWIAKALDLGIPIDNDIGLFFQSLGSEDWMRFDTPPRVIAVTGSNGKSTTSALIHHCLTSFGTPSSLAGNIGTAVFEIEEPEDGAVIVLELSSYQTELARALTPDVAVFTNLTPDHLDRHGGMGGYFAAKRRLFSEGGPDRAIVGVDEGEGRFLANQLSQGPADMRVIRISSGSKLSGPGWNVFARKGFLSETRKGRQVASIDLREIAGLPGIHNHQNAAAAYGALRAIGLGPRAIDEAFRSFAGLPHRSQHVGERGGVTFVNDSKATNVDSAAKALAAFDSIRWIVGGQVKEGGLSALHAARDHVRKAYVIGRHARETSLELTDFDVEVCETMEAAVARAIADAEPGDTVLLAPAAASFDQYDNFEQRGQHFIDEVSRYLV